MFDLIILYYTVYKCDWVLIWWSGQTPELTCEHPASYVFSYKCPSKIGNVVLNDVHNHAMKRVTLVKEEK